DPPDPPEAAPPPVSDGDTAAADAFWSSPDPTQPAGTATPHTATPYNAPSAGTPAPSFGDRPGGRRRRRRRRRRHGAPVQTEQPIDSPEMAQVVQRLRRQFGLHSFRPGQERIIRNVLARMD